ncbi:MAG: hypothetical protein WCA30_17490 [Dermatophilaceae bacterium]
MRSVPPRSIMPWSLVLSVLVVVSSLAGLLDPRVYDQETENWTTQAWGQDLGNLLAVAVLLAAALRYRGGSHRAGLVWLGTLMYLIYAFIVYAMAVHLNYLFLVYVAVLGLSAWAVIFHVSDLRARTTAYPHGRPRTVAAGVLVATGVLFAALWLSELVPALLTDSVPASLTEAGLRVNPIHVIDLSVVLPGFIISGVAALKDREHGLFWLAPWLVFSVLMGTSIVAAMLLMMASGAADALPPAVLVSILVLASLVALAGYLRAFGAGREPPAVRE